MAKFVKLPRKPDAVEVAINPDWIIAIQPVDDTTCTLRFAGGDTRYALIECGLSQDAVLALLAAAA
jgi:hypothetical protein